MKVGDIVSVHWYSPNAIGIIVCNGTRVSRFSSSFFVLSEGSVREFDIAWLAVIPE